MPRQTRTIRQSAVDRKPVWRFDVLSGGLRPTEKDNVVPFRGPLHSQVRQLCDVSFAEPKAENSALRNLAVELALEIRNLNDGRRRPQTQRYFVPFGSKQSSGLGAVTRQCAD
jgi:hypothetical protein